MPIGPDFDSVLGAAREGADWAWALLYRDLAGPVTGYLVSRRAPDPEDVTAETFLQIARGIHAFEGGEEAFRSWVFVIAHRRLVDARRKAMREPNLVALPVVESGYQGGNVETEAMDRLVTAELEQAFQALTDDQHDVLALRIIANLTLEETADAVGKRVGAVKALQRRGLIALRTHLDQGRVST